MKEPAAIKVTNKPFVLFAVQQLVFSIFNNEYSLKFLFLQINWTYIEKNN